MSKTVVDQFVSVSVTSNWMAAFERHLESVGCSARTIEAYRQDLRAFSVYFERANGEPFTPELLNGVDLRGYRQYALDHRVAPATFNRRRASLARLARWAIEAGIISYNPMQGVDRLEEEDLPPRWLELHEERKFLRQVELRVNGSGTKFGRMQAVRDQAMIGLMLYAGLREAEVCQLDVSDLQITERKGRVVIWQGKGGKKREVPLNAEVRRMIRLWLAVSGRSEGALFVGKGGNRVGPKAIQQLVIEIRRAAGLDADVTPHALRHTFAKRMADDRQPLQVIQKLLGHARLETTGRYIQPGWGDLEEAVERV